MTDYRPGVALIVVDVQNDFADPAGSLYVPAGEQVVATVNGQIAEARAAGAHVVDPGLASRAHAPLRTGRGHLARPLRRDTWGAEFHPDLGSPTAPPSSARARTARTAIRLHHARPDEAEGIPDSLDPLLREARVDEVIVIGLATDYCIKATVLDALDLGYKARLLQDAVAAVDLRRATAKRRSRRSATRAARSAGRCRHAAAPPRPRRRPDRPDPSPAAG